MVRWRIGKSALMAGTFSITFAGFAMRCPLAMTGSILESSCDGTSADPASEFQLDEAVHFDRVLDGDPLRHHPGGPQDDHPEGLVLRHPAGRHVEEHFVAHPADGSFLDDLRVRLVKFDRGGGLGARLRIEHQRGPFDPRFDPGGSGSTRTAECKVARPPRWTMPRLMIFDRVRGARWIISAPTSSC